MRHSFANFKPELGIVTALGIEYLAMKALVDDGYERVFKGLGKCFLGKIFSTVSGFHSLVLTQAGMGNNLATHCAEKLLNRYPSIDTIIMVGIAGAVPDLEKAENHVRLGDIVVVGRTGIAQYDFVKKSEERIEYRFPPRPPKASLLQAAETLKREEEEGKFPWNKFIMEAIAVRGKEWKRPPTTADKLESSKGIYAKHPRDPRRRKGEPRVFLGTFASGNTLLKDPITRDRLRNELGARAIEMEASGIADASWANEINYFAVRGTCDYCDENKNDIWQKYAAIVAASYTKALLASIPGINSDIVGQIPQEYTDTQGRSSTESSGRLRTPLCEVEVLFKDFNGDAPPILQINQHYTLVISITALDEIPLDYIGTHIGVFVVCPNAEIKPDRYQDIRVPTVNQAMSIDFVIKVMEPPNLPLLDVMILIFHETTHLTSLPVKISWEL